MTNYWIVETYTKKLMSKVSLEDDTLHQQVLYAKGAPNERCYLEAPSVTGNESDDYVTVNGDPGTHGEEGAAGASALSLSYNEQGHKDACVSRIRTERDPKLGKTDWTQTLDVVSSGTLTQQDQDDWATYRQALRDLPDPTSTPDPRDFDFDNGWPTDPV